MFHGGVVGLLTATLLVTSVACGGDDVSDGAMDGAFDTAFDVGRLDAGPDSELDAAIETDAGDGGVDAMTMLSECEAMLVRVSHPPVTGAGPSDLGDNDTDDNGILDRDEWGPVTEYALDQDGDGTPDYLDLDDDADGLLDRFDPERLEPAPSADPPSSSTVEHSSTKRS